MRPRRGHAPGPACPGLGPRGPLDLAVAAAAVPQLDPQAAHAAPASRRPRCRRARCRGSWAASDRGRPIGSTPSPRKACGSGLVVGASRARPASREQHAVASEAVAVGRRVELVGPEEQRRRGANSGPRIEPSETVRPPGLDDRDGLGGGQPARPGPARPAQRRRDRLDRAEVGAGADDDLDAGVAQPAYGLGEVPHRLRRQHRVGHVVGADQDHRDVGLDRQGRSIWPARSRGLGADDGELAQVHPPVGPLGDARWPAARRASPRPARRRSPPRWSRRAAPTLIAGPGRPRPYQPVASGGGSLLGADGPAGQLGLGASRP